MFVIFVVN